MADLVPESEQQYGSILTVLGESAEQNGKMLKKPVEFTHIAFGDANDTYVQPDRKSQSLVNELYRIPVNSVDVLQATPDSVPILTVEALLPDDIHDVVIREFAAVATFNGQEYFHAIGNCARIYVPSPINNGQLNNPVSLEMTFAITSVEPIVLIDPNVITASREYVKKQIIMSDERVTRITANLDMNNELMNVARADGYLDKANLWSMRNIVMIGDSHGWGEGAPNYQGAGSGHSVHSPWIHNKGFFGRLVDHLYKKMDTEPWCVLPLAYGANPGERRNIIYGRDNQELMVFKEFFTKTPIYARGRFMEYSFTANQGNNFTNRDVAAGAQLRGDSYAVTEYKYLASIGLFNEYQFEMAPDIHRENDHNITITSWGDYIKPSGWTLNQNKTGGVSDVGKAFVHIWPYTESASAWLYVDAIVYISGLNAFCKVTAIDSYGPPNGFHTNVFLTYGDGSDIPLSEIEKIRSNDTINRDFEGQACVVLDLETPTRYVVLGVNHHSGGSIVEVDLLPPYAKDLYKNPTAWGDWTWGKSNVSIKVLKANGNLEVPGDYAVVDNTNFKIIIDTSKAPGYFMPYVIDFGQKKAGRLRIRHVGDGAEATGVRSWSGTTSFTCKGALVNNLDYIKNWSMGGHTIGAWLGQENSYWGEQRDHVADILSYSPVRPTAVIVETPLVNEWLKQTPLATFKQRLIDLAFAFNQGNMLVTTTLGTHAAEFGEDTANITYEDYANVVKEWAKESAGKVTLIDCRAHLKRLVKDGTAKSVDLYLNNGHPSPMANEIMFKHLKRIVDWKL
ncbi:phage tail protein [Vibrio vulnificus]|nr:phage tail protein [Vibrio vulnificus]